MLIVATALPEFRDPYDEPLFLGSWCLPPDDPSGVRGATIPDPWSDRAELERAAEICRDTHRSACDAIGRTLNGIHGLDHAPRYWRLLIGPWLLYHIQQLYDRYRRVSLALERYPNARIRALDPADFRTPRDSDDFRTLFHDDHYNLQLVSQVLLALRPELPTLRCSSPRGRTTDIVLPSLWRRAYHAVRAAVNEAAVRRGRFEVVTDGLYPLGRRHWALSRAMNWRIIPILKTLPTRMRVAGETDASRRRALALEKGRGEFERILYASLPAALPSIFLEGFARARKYCLRGKERVPAAVFFSSGIYYNDYFKFCAAEYASRGARVWGCQHGAQYGTALFTQSEWLERSVSDRYFTWGWAKDSPESLVDAPAPHFSVRPSRRPSSDVLYVSTAGLRAPHELFPAPLGEEWEDFFAWRERFVGALSPLGFGSLLLRLFPADYGWDQRRRLLARYPRLRLDDTRAPLARGLRGVGMVVTDHPGTTCWETMALDIPGVHFWDERLWPFRPDARPHLAALRRAGIVQPDPESAARMVDRVRDDPRAWWDDAQTRAAREAFVRKYARTSANWVDDWVRVLEAELRRPRRETSRAI